MISIKNATFATILLLFAMKIGETQPIRNSDPIHTSLCVRMRDESDTRSNFSMRMTCSLDSDECWELGCDNIHHCVTFYILHCKLLLLLLIL